MIVIFAFFINSCLFDVYAAVDPAGAALLQRLFDSHYKRLLGIANQILLNQADAEEAVSDTYYKVWRHLGEFEELSEVDTVRKLTVITRNAAFDLRRKNNAKKNKTDSLIYVDEDSLREYDIPDMTGNPEYAAITQERIEAITAYIDALDEPDHTILLLKFKFGRRTGEIAEQLGMSRTQIDNRISRARAQIRRELKEWRE